MNQCEIRKNGEGYIIKVEDYNCEYFRTERQVNLHKALHQLIDQVNEKFGIRYILFLDDVKNNKGGFK